MKKLRVIVIIAASLLLPQISRAQLTLPTDAATGAQNPQTGSQPSFAFTYGSEIFNVPSALLEQWHHPVSFAQNNSLVRQPVDLDNLLARFAGQADAPTPYRTVNYDYDPGQIFNFIKETASGININPVEPAMSVDNSRVTAFTPPQDGRSVDIYATLHNTLLNLQNGATSTELSVSTTSPKSSLAELNNLGIKELVAQGTSNFKGSPKNRIHNIIVGVQKMSGIIVAPGAEFSFDDSLGPVDGDHGFLPELVIKAKDTVPEFGGGLCQVSTTTFRAAMAAGLPITERRNHAYAVQYYSPQGTDATIYPGVVDLKFINDTPGNLLIWPHIDGTILTFDFYGTKDGRQVNIEKPIVYDRQTDGSMKASWSREVTKDGATSTSTFKSIYQPPALFHHDTTSSTTPPSAADFHV